MLEMPGKRQAVKMSKKIKFLNNMVALKPLEVVKSDKKPIGFEVGVDIVNNLMEIAHVGVESHYNLKAGDKVYWVSKGESFEITTFEGKFTVVPDHCIIAKVEE